MTDPKDSVMPFRYWRSNCYECGFVMFWVSRSGMDRMGSPLPITMRSCPCCDTIPCAPYPEDPAPPKSEGDTESMPQFEPGFGPCRHGWQPPCRTCRGEDGGATS